MYEGESSRNGKIRGGEHIGGFKNKKVTNALYKHKLMDHPNEEVKFEMEVLKSYKDPLSRLANEGVRINEHKPGELLNSKSEFHQPAIVRLQIEKNRKMGLGQGQAAEDRRRCGN